MQRPCSASPGFRTFARMAGGHRRSSANDFRSGIFGTLAFTSIVIADRTSSGNCGQTCAINLKFNTLVHFFVRND
jgi:hypothetical protein